MRLLTYFSRQAQNFWPHHPEGAVARDVPHRLVGGPAALFHVEVEGTRADAKLKVGEPGGADIYDTGHHTRRDPDK